MDSTTAHSASFEPTLASGPQARRFVVALLKEWMLDDLVDDAALCVTELSTNAIHHTRDRFIVTVRPAGPGVRIEVLDNAPDQLPATVPSRGTAVDLTKSGTTGRGLQIVAAVASRWGFTTTTHSKHVWVELTGEHSDQPVSPMITIGHHRPPAPDQVTLCFVGLPVRSVVASGIQVDELVRDVQLHQVGDSALDAGDSDRLFDLLDHSADVRFAGRHAAMRAGAAGRTRFDLDLVTTLSTVRSAGELRKLLGELSDRYSLFSASVDQEVAALREWLTVETLSQLSGADPRMCPLDAPLPPAEATAAGT